MRLHPPDYLYYCSKKKSKVIAIETGRACCYTNGPLPASSTNGCEARISTVIHGRGGATLMPWCHMTPSTHGQLLVLLQISPCVTPLILAISS
jgi:hypothetical protein